MSEERAAWTIYDRPREYPCGTIARKFLIGAEVGGVPRWTSETLIGHVSVLRRYFEERGLARFPRDPHDPPAVVETWL